MRTSRAFWTAVLGIMISGLLPISARGAPITYVEQVTASGDLGATPFTNELVTLTVTADTTGVTGTLQVQNSSASVNVMGVGFGTFTVPTVMFVNQGASRAGLRSGTIATPGTDILDTVNAAFATYNLTTAIGPVSGGGIFNSGVTFATTAGNFRLTSAGNVTFTATLNPTSVPEPSTLALFTLGGATLAGWRRSRKGRSRLG